MGVVLHLRTLGITPAGALTVVTSALTLMIAACEKKPPPAPPPAAVVVAPAMQRTIVDWDDYVGRFEAVDAVQVRPRVSGYLQSVSFQDGQVVKKGQLLFVIDPRPYQALYNQAKAQEQRLLATVASAQTELRRAQELVEARAASEQELESRRAAALQAAADLAAVRATLQAQALNLSFTRVVAPMSGRISDRRVAPGNLVTQDQTVLTTIVNLDPIRFVFEGSEANYLKYQRLSSGSTVGRVGGTVQIRLQDEPDYRWNGRLDFVDNQLDVSSGVIRGRAVVQNSQGFLTPGLYGRMRLQSSAPYAALLLPEEAVGTDQNRRFVYVVGPDNKTMERQVATGPLIDGLRVIRSGVKPGERVVIEGTQRVRPGQTVNPRAGQVTPPTAGSGPTFTAPASSATAG